MSDAIADLDLITEGDLAAQLKVLPRTLRNWRKRGAGPAYLRMEKAVFYRLTDVREWIASRVQQPSPPSTQEDGQCAT